MENLFFRLRWVIIPFSDGFSEIYFHLYSCTTFHLRGFRSSSPFSSLHGGLIWHNLGRKLAHSDVELVKSGFHCSICKFFMIVFLNILIFSFLWMNVAFFLLLLVYITYTFVLYFFNAYSFKVYDSSNKLNYLHIYWNVLPKVSVP